MKLLKHCIMPIFIAAVTLTARAQGPSFAGSADWAGDEVSTAPTPTATEPAWLTLSAPADITISCAAQLHQLEVTGNIHSTAKEVGITYMDVNMDWGPCEGGTVLRRFTVSGPDGQARTFDQHLYIVAAAEHSVEMPESFCAGLPGLPEDFGPGNLPEGRGYPVVRGDGCNVDMLYQDEVKRLPGGSGDRVRITRTWTVCDPCATVPCRTHVQLIGAEFIKESSATEQVAVAKGAGPFELLQNKPNPFARGTVIGFVLPEASDINLAVQHADGRVVQTWEGSYPAGYNEIFFDNDSFLGQGVLFYTLTTAAHKATKRMVLVR